MTIDPDERYWPFPVHWPGGKLTEFDRDWLTLMETAFAEGYQPRDNGQGFCVVLGQWPVGRSVNLFRRGRRNGWEIVLGESDTQVRLGPMLYSAYNQNTCICIRPPFRDSASFALEWMRGRSLKLILAEYDFAGGSPPGIKLRSPDSSLKHTSNQ